MKFKYIKKNSKFSIKNDPKQYIYVKIGKTLDKENDKEFNAKRGSYLFYIKPNEEVEDWP